MNPDLDPDDGMISRPALAKELLLYRMKQLSEGIYSADWLTNLEFEIWEMAFGEEKTFGNMEVSDRMAKLFRDLAILSDGWWVWSDATKPSEDSPVFIPMARWKEILKNHKPS